MLKIMLTPRLLLLSFSLVFYVCEQIPRQGGICYYSEHFSRRGIINPRCLLKKTSVSMHCRDTNVYCITISYQGINVGDFYGGAVECSIQSTNVLPEELCTMIQIQTKEDAIRVQKCITFCTGHGCNFLEYLQGRRTSLQKWHQMRLMDLLSRELASSYKQEIGKSLRRYRRSTNTDNVALFSQDAAASVSQDPSVLLNWTERSDNNQIFQTSSAIAKPRPFSEQNVQAMNNFPTIPVVSGSQSLISDASHEPMLHIANSEMADGLFEDTTSQQGPIGVAQHRDFASSVDLAAMHLSEVPEDAASTDSKDLKMSTKPPDQAYIKNLPEPSSGRLYLPEETHLFHSFNKQNAFFTKTSPAFDGSQIVRYSPRGNGNVLEISSCMCDLFRTNAREVATDALSSSAFHFTECSAGTDSLIVSSLSPVKMIPLSILSTLVNTYSSTNSVAVSDAKMTSQLFDQAQDGPILNATPHIELTGSLHIFNTQAMEVEHLSSFFSLAPWLLGTITSDCHQYFVSAFKSRGIHLGSDNTEMSANIFTLTTISKNFQTTVGSGHHHINGNPSGDEAQGVEALSIVELQSVSASSVNNADQLVHSDQIHSVVLGTLMHCSMIQNQHGGMFSMGAPGTPENLPSSQRLNRASSDLFGERYFDVHSMPLTTLLESSTASMVDLLTLCYSDTYLISDYLQSNVFPVVSDVSSQTTQVLSCPMSLFNISTLTSLSESFDTVALSKEIHIPSVNNVGSSSTGTDEFPLYVSQPTENMMHVEVNPSIVSKYSWNDGYQRVSSKISDLETLGSVLEASFPLETNGMNSVVVNPMLASSSAMLSQEVGSSTTSALASPQFRTVVPSMNMISFTMLPSLIITSTEFTSSAFEADVLFNSRFVVQKDKIKSTKVSSDLEYLEANEVIALILSVNTLDANTNQLPDVLGEETVLISRFHSSTKWSSQDILNKDLPTPLSIENTSLYAMQSFFPMMHTLDAKELFDLSLEIMAFSLSSNLDHSTAQSSGHSCNTKLNPFTAEFGNNISSMNGSNLKTWSSITHSERETGLTSLDSSVLQPSFMKDKIIPFQSSGVLLWKTSSEMKTTFSLRKVAEYPLSYHGDTTLPTFTTKSEFVFPSKDITHLAFVPWVSLPPQRATPALVPGCIFSCESVTQHSCLRFDNFDLFPESLSSDLFHLGNEELTEVLATASEEDINPVLPSSTYLKAHGDSSIALVSGAAFLLTDEFGIRLANKLNTGWFFTLTKRILCTSLDVTGSEDFSKSITNLALQSKNALGTPSTVIITNYAPIDASNIFMKTVNIPSSFVDSNSMMLFPIVMKSGAVLSGYFTLGEQHTSWFSDVSSLIKHSIHLLTPELFSISVSSSATSSPTPLVTDPLNDMASWSYGDSFILKTSPKLFPKSLEHPETSILKLMSQQSELASHALRIQISSAAVAVTVSSGMPDYFLKNIFLSVTGMLTSGSSAFVTSTDMILPFSPSQPSEVKMTILKTDTGWVSRDPKLTEVFPELSTAFKSNYDTGDITIHYSKALEENLPSTEFLSAMEIVEPFLDAVVMISSPELFLHVESSMPITMTATVSDPNLLPISSPDAKSYFAGSMFKQISKEILLIPTLFPFSSQTLEQSVASLTRLSSFPLNGLSPLEGRSCASLPTLSVLSDVICTEFDMIFPEDLSFVPRATLPSSSRSPLISAIEPSLSMTMSSLQPRIMLSSKCCVPFTAMWEMLKPRVEVSSCPTHVAPQNPTVPTSSLHPTLSLERNRTVITLIKEENLLQVTLQINGSVTVFKDSFWQTISKGLKETYLQALASTGESNQIHQTGEASENVQVVVDSVRWQIPDLIDVQFVVLSNGQLLKASDVTVTFKRLANLIPILSGNLPYQVVKAPCPVANLLSQPLAHSSVGWMVAVYVLASFCLSLLALLFYCMKKARRNGEDMTVSQQGTFRREQARASNIVYLRGRKLRADDIEKGLPDERSPSKDYVTTLA